MKILVIIVSYNFERWIDRCLNSLRQSEQQADVVVIDNASQDRTVSLIESRYPEVRLIKSKENLGFGRANNIGMKIALKEGYDAVFLLNQDAWIDAKVLGELSELSRSHPRYGAHTSDRFGREVGTRLCRLLQSQQSGRGEKAKTAGTYVIITTRLLKRTAEVRKFRKQSKLRNANYLQ